MTTIRIRNLASKYFRDAGFPEIEVFRINCLDDKALSYIKGNRTIGESWRIDGHYRTYIVKDDKTIHIGCHPTLKASILAIAKEILR